MIKQLFLFIVLLFICACSDDPYELKIPPSEKIRQNLLPAIVNGKDQHVGIFTTKRPDLEPDAETIDCKYFLENSSETAYGLYFSIKYELLIKNTTYKLEEKKIEGGGFILYIGDFVEFFQIYKIDSTSYIQTYEVSKKWATMDLHLKYYKTAHKDYYTNMKDTVEVIAKNVKVRRYNLCEL